ncbi:glutamate ligase domain-containing protein [Streptomyces sp. CC210A]|uniref:glutamate ligase domain-containing protein n=1 Tax=Streptomyces sp. CC210A TaxID=2898184 RepID=UPI001F1DC759|nr:cyanophycin synthetase [Streptomyces sp. CC210A]
MTEAGVEAPETAGGRRVAVLGEMLELGDESVEAHREVGRFAAEVGIDLVLAIGGDLAKQLALAAGDAGVPDVAMVGDNKTAAAFLHTILQPGDTVLVKASRGGQLWQIAQSLTGQPVTDLSGNHLP